jgi:hypothetical protein
LKNFPAAREVRNDLLTQVMALIARNHPPYDPPRLHRFAKHCRQESTGAESSARVSSPNKNSRLFTRGTAQPENVYE